MFTIVVVIVVALVVVIIVVVIVAEVVVVASTLHNKSINYTVHNSLPPEWCRITRRSCPWQSWPMRSLIGR